MRPVHGLFFRSATEGAVDQFFVHCELLKVKGQNIRATGRHVEAERLIDILDRVAVVGVMTRDRSSVA